MSKKAQRTKGNAKPSSSSRAANFLNQEGKAGFIGFSGLQGNNLGYVPQVKGDEEEISGDLQMLMRKMTKKDTVTKLKATQEFTELCKVKDNEAIGKILSFWPRIYHKLSHDFDHRVREATQQVHYQLVTKAGKKLAPHLKLIIVDWLMSHFDNYVPSAAIAKSAFDQAFQEKKRKDVFNFCKSEIFEAVSNQILNESPDTLSDPKVVPVEEREAKFTRYISSSFHSMSLLLKNLPENDETTKSHFVNLLSQKKFWKFVKHKSPMIRSSFYTFITVGCQNGDSLFTEYLSQLCPAVLTHLDEQDSSVVKPMWDAVLLCLLKYNDCWTHVNSRKAVFPGLWKLLKNCGYDNVQFVYPNFLPFITNIPKEVSGDGLGFYNEFFTNFTEGLHSKEGISQKDADIIIKSLMECIRFLIVKRADETQLIEYIFNEQLRPLIHLMFSKDEEPKIWYPAFITEMKTLLFFLAAQSSNTQIESSEYFKGVEQKLWSIVTDVIVDQNTFTFRYIHSSSFNTLNVLLNCFCIEISDEKSDNVVLLEDKFNGNLFQFLQTIVKSILPILDKENYIRKYFVKMVIHASSKSLLVYTLNEFGCNGDFKEAETISVVQCFAEKMIKSFIEKDFDIVFVKTLVAIACLLSKDDKWNYLSFLLKDFFTDATMKSHFFLELTHNKDTDIQSWWLTHSVQEELEILCTNEKLAQTDACWVICRFNIRKLKDNPLLVKFSDSVLTLMDKVFGQPDSSLILHNVFECFNELAISHIDVTDSFRKMLYSILKTSSTDLAIPSKKPLKNGMTKIARSSDEVSSKFVKDLVDQVYSWTKEIDVQDLSRSIYEMIFTLQKDENTSKLCGEVTVAVLTNEKDLDDPSTHNFCTLLVSQLLENIEDLHFDKQISSSLLDQVVQLLCNMNEMGSIDDMLDQLMVHEALYKDFFDKLIQRSIETDYHDQLSYVLTKFQDNAKLTEDILDQTMQLASEDTSSTSLRSRKVLALIVSFNYDVSSVRAMVEMYTDSFYATVEKKDISGVTGDLIVLTSALKRWYHFISQQQVDNEDETSSDHHIKVLEILTLLRSASGGLNLSSLELNELTDHTEALRVAVVDLFIVSMTMSSVQFSQDHWDFILCTLVSWLKNCEDEEDFTLVKKRSLFATKSLELFYMVASLFSPISDDTIDSSPSVGLCDVTFSSLGDNNQLKTEWDEFFGPTVNASVLVIFKKSLESGGLQHEDELTKAICACCKFLQEVNNESTEELTSMIQNGSWCYKLAGFQLLSKNITKLEEMCFDLEQDENHEEQRSFPKNLLAIMEVNRDTTVNSLTNQCASIIEPANEIEDTESRGGKTSLLAYLLSWQLILQIFQTSSLDQRAKLANFLHRGRHVTDLATCLFCIMPKQTENKAIDTRVYDSSFKEIQKIGIKLLINAMQCIPALLRHWFKNNINRNETIHIDK
ncbi:E3 ubiquitin-protein ligase listerin-like [Clytia hemisphaerica]|uniref:E3 ubiquitin-protein ligase listerin n=1 Tax=Clytia hemisphaerica TaxID=252671 RepID=A0A7M5WKF5_9CNID